MAAIALHYFLTLTDLRMQKLDDSGSDGFHCASYRLTLFGRHPDKYAGRCRCADTPRLTACFRNDRVHASVCCGSRRGFRQ